MTTYNIGDIVSVIDPTPFLDNNYETDGLYFNNKKMSVFIGRRFIISLNFSRDVYVLRYIDECDCLETKNNRIEEWLWNKKWLMPADEFTPDEIDCSDLPDIMSMIRG